MIRIYALSPGWIFRGSHDRGQEARLYLAWLWQGQVELRLFDCYCSILMRPLEWIFPIAWSQGRWIRLGAGVKPHQLRRRLGLELPEACVRVEAGHQIFGREAGLDREPCVPDGLVGLLVTDPCGLPWARKKPAPGRAGDGGEPG